MQAAGSSNAWKNSGGAGANANGVPVIQLDDASLEDDVRFWRVIKQMARAFNDEDRDAYLSLFPPMTERKRRDRESVFDFMDDGG